MASGTAIYLWNRTTGALHLWEKFTATDNQDGMTVTGPSTRREAEIRVRPGYAGNPP